MSALAGFRVLVVPGLHGSGPAHWQTRWERLFPWFERVVQHDWDTSDLATWSARVGEVLRESAHPTLIVAHSFGCLASVHCAARGASSLAGALLVAPADPVKFGIDANLSGASLACPSILVGSLDDPWMAAARAAGWAAQWGSEFVNAGKLGHINADSTLGDWPGGLALLRRLALVARPRTRHRQYNVITTYER
ncbi:MAG TPA: alpha/beta hydrolase [Noviherbaspirillum sp.]|uniref:RBBP9/YdeN family alpha/beta hydrolase n=1 Tax=Noviherbaspirillum sp. TaxID=1926288 RepID=UPI002D254ABB|nr:alpha/beta hydrolase [Noviherbaspirillum sp.]HYD97722.1 alpha/beta hydrolase [Noviherbaspirillum sp.]